MSYEPEYDTWQAYLDGELSPTEQSAIQEQLANDPPKRQAFEAFAAELKETHRLFQPVRALSNAFQVEAGWRRLSSSLPSEQKQTARTVPWMLWLSLGATTALAGLLLFLPNLWLDPTLQPHHPPQQWLTKGASISMLHQHSHQKTSVQTQNGARLYTGDFVQFVYRLSKPAHVMVVSINDVGHVSKYIPLEQPKSQKLGVGKGTLPKKEAIELDNSSGRELFLALASQKPFSYAKVKAALVQAFRHHTSKVKDLKLTKHSSWRVVYTVWVRKKKARFTPKP